MKKLVFLLLVFLLSVALVGCTSTSEEKQRADAPAATEVVEVKPDEALMAQLIDSVGSDLMARAKAANFQLNTKFRNFAYQPYEGWEPREGDCTDDILYITVEVYAPKAPGVAADSELMRELQYAIIDSNIFDLTEEEKAELKSISYSPENREDRLNVKDQFVELHFLEFDAKAVLTISNINNGMKTDVHFEDWHRTYKWEEFFN